MQQPMDDCGKRRLTERADMIAAVDVLHRRGFGDDDLATQLARFYYIDVDLLNDVIRAARPSRGHRLAATQARAVA